MKRSLFTMFLALASLVRSHAAAGVTNVVSPEVHADRTVTFRIAAPKATEVTLTGDWVDGAQKLTNADDGVWSVTLGPMPPSTYIYTFNVDGVLTVDPINPRTKIRTRGSGSLVVVPADSPSVQEARDVPHGAVEVNWQKSSVLGETRRVLVYTPPGYSQNTSHRYPVLLLLHGSGDNADSWATVGNLNFIADNLIAKKKMTPMVIVMPNFYSASFVSPPPHAGGGSRRAGGGDDAVAGAGGGDNGAGNSTYYKYLLEEALPMVEAKYRIAAGRKNHAVAGFSKGANQSLDLFFSHFDLFSSVGALCPSKYEPIENKYDTLLDDSKNMNAKTSVLWLGCGRQDPQHFPGSQRVDEVLTAHQINHVWHPTEGVHNYAIWRDYLVEFLPLLFQSGGNTPRSAAR
jgi:enterochelin esterase-like enzyme